MEAAIAKKPNLSVKGRSGLTALHLAAIGGHTKVITALANAGGLTLLTEKSTEGKFAHEYAALHNHANAEKELINLFCIQSADSAAAAASMSCILSKENIKDMVLHILSHTYPTIQQGPGVPIPEKFVTESSLLVCGEFEHAARGFYELLNVCEGEVSKRASRGVAAIEEEVAALGDQQVMDELDYILHQKASEKELQNGVCDQGHEGMLLKDFVSYTNTKTAKLEEQEVVALRLYTTSAFQQINGPLRDQERIKQGKEHPLPVTVTLIARGIKKLRTVGADTNEATGQKILWRGMCNVKPSDQFAQKGGTEVGKSQNFSFATNVAPDKPSIWSLLRVALYK